MKTIHDQLVALGTPIVKHYIRDLTFHDKNACELMRPHDVAFWSPRECGTEFIYCPADDVKTRDWNRDYLKAAEKTYPGRQWFKIEDGRVTPIAYADALDRF